MDVKASHSSSIGWLESKVEGLLAEQTARGLLSRESSFGLQVLPHPRPDYFGILKARGNRAQPRLNSLQQIMNRPNSQIMLNNR